MARGPREKEKNKEKHISKKIKKMKWTNGENEIREKPNEAREWQKKNEETKKKAQKVSLWNIEKNTNRPWNEMTSECFLHEHIFNYDSISVISVELRPSDDHIMSLVSCSF